MEKHLRREPEQPPAHSRTSRFCATTRWLSAMTPRVFFRLPENRMSSEEWREHFLRTAGTPIFAVDAAGFAVADGSFAADAGRISFAATGYAAGPIAMGSPWEQSPKATNCAWWRTEKLRTKW